jgi:endonuclease-3
VFITTMPTIINKQRLLHQILAMLAKPKSEGDKSAPVLEQFVYAICREGVTREQADRVYRHLRKELSDWNEIRVSTVREIAEIFAGLPHAERRAQRLIEFLQEVFETTYSFDLDSLQKKGVKHAAKHLSRYHAANDYAVAFVVQHSLGGHALPLDGPSQRVLVRLGLLDSEDGDCETQRASLEHQIPKSRGPQFSDLISNLAEEVCRPDEPLCSACPLAHLCSYAQLMRPTTVSSVRAKPR